jgi:hypothetical protein
VGDDVNRVKLLVPIERSCHLPRCWPPRIKHDGINLGAQVSKDCFEIGNGRIDEEKF